MLNYCPYLARVPHPQSGRTLWWSRPGWRAASISASHTILLWSVVPFHSRHQLSTDTRTQNLWQCVGPWSARLTPFRVASSSARFMCLESFSGRSQQASSMMNSSTARATPRASELASTQTVNSFPSTHQFPRTGSSWVTLATVSVSMLCKAASRTSSSHPDYIDVARRFIATTATLSQPHTG